MNTTRDANESDSFVNGRKIDCRAFLLFYFILTFVFSYAWRLLCVLMNWPFPDAKVAIKNLKNKNKRKRGWLDGVFLLVLSRFSGVFVSHLMPILTNRYF